MNLMSTKSNVDLISEWNSEVLGATGDQRSPMAIEHRLRTDYEATLAEHRALQSRALPVDEMVASMREQVAAWATAWQEEEGSRLRSCLSPTFKHDDDGRVRRMVPGSLNGWGGGVAKNLTFRDLAGLAPEIVADNLERAIRAGNFKIGPPLAERKARIAECEARISAIEVEHTNVVRAAAACTPPIFLSLLPTVRERRDVGETKGSPVMQV